MEPVAPPAEYDVRRAFVPAAVALAGMRMAIAVALLALGVALLALLNDAQRGPRRVLQVGDGALSIALQHAVASVWPLTCLAGCAECLLPVWAACRLRPAALLLACSFLLAAAGAWLAWAWLDLDAAETPPKRVALLAAAGLLFLLVGALQAALWLAANLPNQRELQTLPLAWQLALAGLAALALGGRWGWAALDGKMKPAAARREARWRDAAAVPLPELPPPANEKPWWQ